MGVVQAGIILIWRSTELGWQNFDLKTPLEAHSDIPVAMKRKTPPGRTLAALNSWRCGELNPGPVTEPSVFYVRSPLAFWQFFCPHP